MAPRACLSPVVTLALLLLTTGFALGGHHTLSKKKHHPHTMIARFLPLANDSAASSHQRSQGHNISARLSVQCPDQSKRVKYSVVVWTTNWPLGDTDGDVRIRLVGDVCQTGWHNLDHPWPYDDFQKSAGDTYTFSDKDIGTKVTEVHIHLSPSAYSAFPTWYLTKVDTYYKSVKRPFYWNNWVEVDKTQTLKKTGSNALAVTASTTTVVVFVVTTWFMT